MCRVQTLCAELKYFPTDKKSALAGVNKFLKEGGKELSKKSESFADKEIETLNISSKEKAAAENFIHAIIPILTLGTIGTSYNIMIDHSGTATIFSYILRIT